MYACNFLLRSPDEQGCNDECANSLSIVSSRLTNDEKPKPTTFKEDVSALFESLAFHNIRRGSDLPFYDEVLIGCTGGCIIDKDGKIRVVDGSGIQHVASKFFATLGSLLDDATVVLSRRPCDDCYRRLCLARVRSIVFVSEWDPLDDALGVLECNEPSSKFLECVVEKDRRDSPYSSGYFGLHGLRTFFKREQQKPRNALKSS